MSQSKSLRNSRPAFLKLSDVLRQAPSAFDSSKISVVEKFINEIDILPEKFQTAETLFLSNNNIRSLQNIPQFRSLRVLSIANNCLADLAQIEHLKTCSRLQILNLEGNALCQIPNYRCHILARLAKLRLLDNKEITPLERKQADLVIKKEEAMLDIMFSNDCLIRKLQNGIHKAKLHLELRSLFNGRIRALNRSDVINYSSFNTKLFLRLCPYDATTDSIEMEKVTERLRMEVRRVFNLRTYAALVKGGNEAPVHTLRRKPSLPEAWDAAFAEVVLSQQHCIAKLLSAMEDNQQKMEETRTKLLQYDRRTAISQIREDEESHQARARLERENIIREFQHTISQLLDGFREDFDSQAIDYQRKINLLQKQLELFMSPSGDGRQESWQASRGAADTHSLATSNGRQLDPELLPQAPPSRTGESPSRSRSTGRGIAPSQPLSDAAGSSRRALRFESDASLHRSAPSGVREDLQLDIHREPVVERNTLTSAAETTRTTTPTSRSQPLSKHTGPTISKGSKPAQQKPLSGDAGVSSSSRESKPSSVLSSYTLRSNIKHAEDVSTLQQQIERLKAEVEARDEAEAQLADANSKLKGRLELFQRQNLENVEKAEAELEALHKEIQRSREIQRNFELQLKTAKTERADMELQVQELSHEKSDLEAKVQDLKTSLEEKTQSRQDEQNKQAAFARELERLRQENEELSKLLESANAEIHNISSEYEVARKKIELFSMELRGHDQESRNEDMADRFHVAWLERNMFMAFRRSCSRSKLNRARLEVANSYGDFRCQRRFYNWWRLYCIRAAHGRAAASRRCFELVSSSFSRMITFTALHKIKSSRRLVARELYEFTLASRVFQRWRAHFSSTVFTEREGRAFSDLATQHYRKSLLIRYFSSWRNWLSASARPWRHDVLFAESVALRRRVNEAFRAWKRYRQYRRMRHYSADQAVALYMRLHFTRWCRAATAKAAYRQRKLAAYTRSLLLPQRKVFAAWARFRKSVRELRMLYVTALDRYFKSLEKRFFYAWRKTVAVSRRDSRKHLSQDQELERLAWTKWQYFLVSFSRYREHNRLADAFLVRSDRKHLLQCLKAWARHTLSRRQFAQAVKRMEGKRESLLKLRMMYEWRWSLAQVISQQFQTLRARFAELEDRLRAYEARCAESDLEHVRLFERIHAFNRDLTQMQQALNDKTSENVTLSRGIEEATLLESALRAEIDRLQEREHAFEDQIRRMQESSSYRQEEVTANAVHHMLEKQQSEQLIASLRSQAEEQKVALASAERKLRQVQESMETMQQSTQEKLGAAFDIAASLRKLLDEKEQQTNELMRERDQQELALQDLQRKVTVSSQTLVHAIEQGDDRIQDFHRTITRLQAQLSSATNRISEYVGALEEKENQIRKLQYEVQLMQQRETQKMDSFLVELTKVQHSPHLPVDSMHRVLAEKDVSRPRPFEGMWTSGSDHEFPLRRSLQRADVVVYEEAEPDHSVRDAASPSLVPAREAFPSPNVDIPSSKSRLRNRPRSGVKDNLGTVADQRAAPAADSPPWQDQGPSGPQGSQSIHVGLPRTSQDSRLRWRPHDAERDDDLDKEPTAAPRLVDVSSASWPSSLDRPDRSDLDNPLLSPHRHRHPASEHDIDAQPQEAERQEPLTAGFAGGMSSSDQQQSSKAAPERLEYGNLDGARSSTQPLHQRDSPSAPPRSDRLSHGDDPSAWSARPMYDSPKSSALQDPRLEDLNQRIANLYRKVSDL